MTLSQGQRYLLRTDNEYLDGAAVVVAEVMPPPGDGLELAVVNWACGGRRGTYRALSSELVPLGRPDPQSLGYTGDVCQSCQGCRVRRNGACVLCEDCGATSGCS